MAGFKSYNRAFPHLMNSDIRVTRYCKQGSYYLELNKVQIKDFGNKPFLGLSLRGYNEEDRDFSIHYGTEEQTAILKEHFADKIYTFCKKHDCPVTY
jgi:hypothetical protein